MQIVIYILFALPTSTLFIQLPIPYYYNADSYLFRTRSLLTMAKGADGFSDGTSRLPLLSLPRRVINAPLLSTTVQHYSKRQRQRKAT